MRKILALMLAVIMIVGIFALPVMAEESVKVLNENYGKVKIVGKVQTSYNGSTAYAVRSSFGESETQDIISYFVRNTKQDSSNGMEQNPAFDFFNNDPRTVSKTSSTIFENLSVYGGDERTPVQLDGFGWIGASHGMTCGVTVTSNAHGLTYSAIGNVYKDPAGIEWVLLRVSSENMLVFISKNLKSGTDTKPTFHSTMGSPLTNVENAEEVIKVDSYKSGQQLRPAYEMEVQDIYVVNGDEKTLVEANGQTYEGDYVLVEEKYTIMNPVYVAQAIIDQRPEGGYTENPSFAVGKGLVTFDLQQIYNPDGTVVHNWETTYHQDANISVWGGIQYGKKGDYLYIPNTKAFTDKSVVTLNNADVTVDNMTFDFSNIFDSTTGFPNGSGATERWADSSYAPHRRLDFSKTNGAFDKAFAGGQLPVFDNVNSERIQNADKAFYMYKSRKAYFYSASAKINTRYPDLTGKTLKASAYKKWIEDFDANGDASYYSVPYFSDGDNSRYMYFDLYKPGVTKKYDISAYLGTYSISELEKTANLEYDINYETGILTVSSLENNQKAADSLVLKAKYVGESVPAVEMKLRALPTLYTEAINDKLVEIAELMETVGAPEDDYDPALIARYKSLLAQKEAYEQAIKDEAANADRVAGLNNRYETVEMNFPHDAFATDNDFATENWYIKSYNSSTDSLLMVADSPLQYKGFNMQAYGSLSQPAPDNGVAYRASEIDNVEAITKGEDGRYILTIDGVPFRLGEIETADGKIGANAVLFRRQLKADGYTGTEPLNTVSSEYKMEGASGITKATYTLNKDGISNLNILLSDLYVGGSLGANRFNAVTVKYTTGEKETFNSVFNKGSHKFEETVFAVPVETFNSIKNDANKLDSVPTAKELTVDSYKSYVAKYVDQATADSITAKPSSWTSNDTSKAVYAGLNADSKYQALLDAAPVALNTLVADIDAEKFEGISSGDLVTLPTKTVQFVPARLKTTWTGNYNTTYMSNTVIPTNSAKTIETVEISGSLTESGPVALASGGFYTVANSGVHTGALMLKYDGSETIKVGDKEYVIFIKLTRQCGDSAIYGMTLTREQTWLDRIATVEAKMLALSAESSTYADVEALRAEIASLLAQNTSIVYIKDFSADARANIDNVEAALKAQADEEDRIENLTKNVFTHIDMNKYGRDDLFVTDEDMKTSGSRQFGYSNTFTGILGGCTAVDKLDGDVAYKEYYTKDNHLVAVQDVANDTYYYNGDSTYDKDAYSFLGKTYQFKYVAGTTKKYYYKSKGVESSSTSSQGNLYAWYHDGVGAYYEKSVLANNKAMFNKGTAIISGDAFFGVLSDIKDYTTTDKISGNEIKAKTGTLKAENGTEFTVGPFAPAKTATASGIMLTSQAVTVPLGETGVKADYINLLANAFVTDAVNTSYWTVEVDYENEDGSLGRKTFALVLPKSGYSGSTNTSVQGVVDSSIFKVAKDKAQSTYDNVFSNKEATTGISIDDIKFNTKVEGLMIYPSEMVYVGKKCTQHSWYPNPFDNYAGVYKIPVSDLYKVLSVNMKANGGASGYANKETSDLYVEGSMVASNGRAAIPVEVKGGDENYNYYAIYSPNWETRSVLYAANTEKTPAQPKIEKIEEFMQNATLKDVAEIEKLMANLTSDGAVKESDFDKDILEAYNEFKEKSDVAIVEDKLEVKQDEEKVVIKATVANPTKLEGKPYTLIVPFYKGNEVLKTKAYSFESTKETEITKEITVTEVPEGTSNVKVFVWKDLATLKPLSTY